MSSGGDASVPVVVSDVVPLVVFDISGFTVFGMPHIFHSVVLTGLRFYSGLLGHILLLFVLVLMMMT